MKNNYNACVRPGSAEARGRIATLIAYLYRVQVQLLNRRAAHLSELKRRYVHERRRPECFGRYAILK